MTEVYVTFFSLLLNILHKGSSNSAVVCPGDQLILTCSSSTDYLFWTVVSPLTLRNQSQPHSIAVLFPNSVSPPNITVNHTLYQASIISNSSRTSEIIAENVTANVNGTNVTCSGKMTTIYTTTIIFLEGSAPNSSIMVQEEYGAENVTVMLDWIEEQHVLYNLAITTPSMGRLMSHVGSGSAQLTLSYNTIYSVRFVATLCGQNSTSNFKLLYVTCGHPPELPTTAVVTGYKNPALAGTNITVIMSCSHRDNMSTGLNVTFISTYTCMSDGQWEPDPNQINVELCNNDGVVQTSTKQYDISTTTDITCAGLKQNTVIGITISAIIIGIVIFILGCLSGYFWKKCKYSMKSGNTQTLSSMPVVLTCSGNDPQDLKMMENVAYGPLQPINVH